MAKWQILLDFAKRSTQISTCMQRSPLKPSFSCHRHHRDMHSSSLQFAKADSPKSSKITYAVVPKEKSDIIAEFLLRYYHQTEPVAVALGMPLSEVDGWFHRFIRKSMFISLCDASVQAIDEKAKRRVGVLSSVVIDPIHSARLLAKFPNLTDPDKQPLTVKMIELFDTVLKGVDPAHFKGVVQKGSHPPKIMEQLYVSVCPEYQEQGIIEEMGRLSQSLALNILNCRIAYCITTSEFSYNACSQLGYKTVNEIKYVDYVDSKGAHIFAGKEQILHPNYACRVMLKELPSLYD